MRAICFYFLTLQRQACASLNDILMSGNNYNHAWKRFMCRGVREEEELAREREFLRCQTSQLFCNSVSSLYAGYNKKLPISRWTRYDPRWPRHPTTPSHSMIIHQERQTRKREEEWASYTRSTIYVHVRV